MENGSAPGRTRTCGPLLRRQMLCPLSYGGIIIFHLTFDSFHCTGKTKRPPKKASAATLGKKKEWAPSLCGAVMLGRRLCENTPPVESVVDNFAHGRDVGVHVHAITRPQVTEDTLRSHIQRRARQLGIASGLDMVDFLQPLSQRQMPVKIHALLSSFS